MAKPKYSLEKLIANIRAEVETLRNPVHTCATLCYCGKQPYYTTDPDVLFRLSRRNAKLERDMVRASQDAAMNALNHDLLRSDLLEALRADERRIKPKAPGAI